MSQYYSRRIKLFKLICCLLIVLYHIGWKDSFSQDKMNIFFYIKNIGEMAVPSFSFISGLLFYFNCSSFTKVIEKMKRRIYTLAIPYLIWNLIGVIIRTRLHTKVIKAILGDKEALMYLKQYDYFQGLCDILSGKCMPHLWYISMLIIFTLIAPILYLLIKKKYIGLCIMIVMLLLICLYENMKGSTFTYIVYIFGAYVGMNMKYIGIQWSKLIQRIKLNKYINIFIFFFLWMLYAIIPYRRIGFLIEVIAAMILWIILCEVDAPLIPTWLDGTFIVYAMHYWLDVDVSQYINKLFPTLTLLNQLITFIVVTTFCFIVANILRKCVPPIYRCLSGSR